MGTGGNEVGSDSDPEEVHPQLACSEKPPHGWGLGRETLALSALPSLVLLTERSSGRRRAGTEFGTGKIAETSEGSSEPREKYYRSAFVSDPVRPSRVFSLAKTKTGKAAGRIGIFGGAKERSRKSGSLARARKGGAIRRVRPFGPNPNRGETRFASSAPLPSSLTRLDGRLSFSNKPQLGGPKRREVGRTWWDDPADRARTGHSFLRDQRRASLKRRSRSCPSSSLV